MLGLCPTLRVNASAPLGDLSWNGMHLGGRLVTWTHRARVAWTHRGVAWAAAPSRFHSPATSPPSPLNIFSTAYQSAGYTCMPLVANVPLPSQPARRTQITGPAPSTRGTIDTCRASIPLSSLCDSHCSQRRRPRKATGSRTAKPDAGPGCINPITQLPSRILVRWT